MTDSLQSSEQLFSLNPFFSPDFAALAGLGRATLVKPDRLAAPLLGSDRDLGPPVPAPLFAILRP